MFNSQDFWNENTRLKARTLEIILIDATLSLQSKKMVRRMLKYSERHQ